MRVEIVERKGAVLSLNVGHPIVTNGDFVAQLFSAARGGDAALPKLLWDFFLHWLLPYSGKRNAASVYSVRCPVFVRGK